MCGICGEIRFNDKPASARAVEKMMSAMERRGPDAQGMFFQNKSAFGHRRLKIIDLSEKAQQPMIDNHLGLGIVFNGAIYNYKELRQRLEDRYTFFSNGDTEVILKAYHAWGPDCVQFLNGMFAFAVFHRDSGRVFMARDRLGIKPLYYVRDAKRLRFASALPALLAAGGVDFEIDPIALNYYMTFHAVVPPPRTLLQQVKKVPPATAMTVEPDGRVDCKRYWSLAFGPGEAEENHDFADWKRLLAEALRRSVRRRLIADVPVGVLLSGGLDSSLIVGYLAEAGQKSLNTFSIGFESVNGETGDEFEYSDIIAEHFGTVHHQIPVDAARVLPALENCIQSMNEPMVSHDCIGFYLLSEAVSRHVKVVQSGQGADEVFGGYHWYPPLTQSADPVADYARLFFDRDAAEYREAIHERFVSGGSARQFVEQHFAETGAVEPIDKALRLDTTVMLVDDPVKRVDNMTMAWGLEARVPFLDHELVELAARIPARYKIPHGGKYILKEVARQVIPSAVIDRPKGYFPVPVLKYFRGEYFMFVREILGSPSARKAGIFNPAYIDKVLSAPDDHITPLGGSKLWQMALLMYWLQIHQR